jgi:hypothetical protein
VALGVAVAIAVHLVAWLALDPWFRADPASLGPADTATPAVNVELVHATHRAVVATVPSPLQPPSPTAPASEAAPARFAPPSAAGPPSAGAQSDDDPLFRVPFRDAAGEASAELRAGLRCAHVDLPKLPWAVLSRCAAASGRSAGAPIVEAKRSDPIPANAIDGWTVAPLGDARVVR